MNFMQNKYKFWLVLSVVVAFGAGLLGGVFSERYYFHGRRHAQMVRDERRPPHFPSLVQLAQELGLSAEQQEQIKKIFEDNDARLKDLRAEMDTRLEAVRSELKTKMDAVLTPEQKAKFEAKIKEHIQQRKQEAEKRRQSFERDRSQPKPKGEAE
jgi:Spy/CpxP family protein refolding chaperone